MRIYTLTPNPALDLSGHVERLVPNEKNYVFNERRDPGGNGINSARIIHRLGEVPVVALGFAGGSTGDEIAALLKRERVPTRFTRIRGHSRINVTATNDEDNRQTRLTFPGPKITPKERASLAREISRLKSPGILVMGGALPQSLPGSYYASVRDTAARAGLGVIADVPAKLLDSFMPSGRKPHVPLILIKPNQTELEAWCGRALRTDTEILHAARSMLHTTERPGLATLVCVSLAERGAMLLSEGRAWMGIAPKIRARGTVGAGDSMVGAMTTYLAKAGICVPEQVFAAPDRELENALAWGMAAGAATAEGTGTSLAQAAEIRRLRRKVRVEPLVRR